MRYKIFVLTLLLVLLSAVPVAQSTEPPQSGPQEYWALVVRIVDADTFDLEIELGFDVYTRQRVRLVGVDAWEVRGEERPRGLLATAFVKEMMPEGTWVTIVSDGSKGKYGRFLAEVILFTGESLGPLLIAEGHGEPYGK